MGASVARATSSATSVITVSAERKRHVLCVVQLYLPPEYMMNKDFLKGVLIEEKQLLKLNEVNRVNVPHYDELAVATFWPMMHDDERFMRFFPSKLPKGRVPDREYFWNIMHTLHPDYVQNLIRHAQEQRNSAANKG